jgi:hypothetical protein
VKLVDEDGGKVVVRIVRRAVVLEERPEPSPGPERDLDRVPAWRRGFAVAVAR